jgi:hypothetical protein
MEPTILYPSRLKWIGVSLIGFLFSAVGVWMIVDGDGIKAWFCAIFFAAVFITGVLQLLPGTGYLKLDAEGLEFKTLGRSKQVSWGEISGLGTWRHQNNTFVTFEIGTTGKMANLNRSITGTDNMLPDTYGKKAEDLIALMSEYIAAYWENEEAMGRA